MDLLEIVEQSTKELYLKIEHHLPEVTRITFELSHYECTKQLYLHGFIYIDGKIEIYDSIKKLEEFIVKAAAKREILFRRFN